MCREDSGKVCCYWVGLFVDLVRWVFCVCVVDEVVVEEYDVAVVCVGKDVVDYFC